jgi:probable HAF family extracellular repeat protein
MNIRSSMLAVLMAALCAATLDEAAAVTPYRVTDLGTLGGTVSFANAINATGQITGGAATPGDATAHAFLYSAGSMKDLGTLGGSFSQGEGINNSGLVTGFSGTAAGSNRAFLYSGGPMQDLGTLGGSSSFGLDVNDIGQVTGEAQTSVPHTTRAFLYSNGSMQNLGASTGYGINNSGQVTGESGPHAFLYSGGSMQDIHTLGDGSGGRDINASGQVTGFFDDNVAIARRAFLYSGGSMQDLGSIGFYQGSVGLAINADGWVTGVAFPALSDTPDRAEERAFLFDGEAMHDLNGLLDGSGAGWVLHSANDINDLGQIVGYGTHNGVTRAFLLTPVPEPATYALMFAGLGVVSAMAGARRRRRS